MYMIGYGSKLVLTKTKKQIQIYISQFNGHLTKISKAFKNCKFY